MSAALPTLTVLMYHGVPEVGGVDGDAHYAVDRQRFAAQIAAIQASGQAVCSVADRVAAVNDGQAAVCVTFDDGLVSNAWAAEHLASQGGTADFFVNPSTIGTPGFLSWQALREMADAGMSIQSHGMHHRYLDELDPAAVRAELTDSRRAIEDGIGRPVTIYAPAGGRMPEGFFQLAAELGYPIVCSSRVGLWQRGAATVAGSLEVPRLAVLAGTSAGQFARWIRQSSMEIFRQTARYRVLTASKRLLGNQGHEQLRRLLIAARNGVRG
jgi:peptidoglycan/xylan/chitin deacetylase (PgdA/CDA1 family)